MCGVQRSQENVGTFQEEVGSSVDHSHASSPRGSDSWDMCVLWMEVLLGPELVLGNEWSIWLCCHLASFWPFLPRKKLLLFNSQAPRAQPHTGSISSIGVTSLWVPQWVRHELSPKGDGVKVGVESKKILKQLHFKIRHKIEDLSVSLTHVTIYSVSWNLLETDIQQS